MGAFPVRVGTPTRVNILARPQPIRLFINNRNTLNLISWSSRNSDDAVGLGMVFQKLKQLITTHRNMRSCGLGRAESKKQQILTKILQQYYNLCFYPEKNSTRRLKIISIHEIQARNL